MKFNVFVRGMLVIVIIGLFASCNTPVPEMGPTDVIIKTSKGDITVEMAYEKAPKTVANFLKYVDDGHYKNTIFHRVINGFMIQGGGMDLSFQQKATRAPIKNEASNLLKNKRGTIAMARTPHPHSAKAQFFINVKNNPALDFRNPTLRGYGYCVFGAVIDGMDVVDKIKMVPVGNHLGRANVPKENVIIYDIVRVKKGNRKL